MIKGNHFFLKANDSVLNVINNIENSQYQICFIVDDQGSLIGSITDGDIRRGLIEGYAIESHASKIMNSKPISILSSQSEKEAQTIMASNQIKQLPVIDTDNKLIGVHLMDQILNLAPKENSILIMAGGFGKRMMPLTENLPKPMLYLNTSFLMQKPKALENLSFHFTI